MAYREIPVNPSYRSGAFAWGLGCVVLKPCLHRHKAGGWHFSRGRGIDPGQKPFDTALLAPGTRLQIDLDRTPDGGADRT